MLLEPNCVEDESFHILIYITYYKFKKMKKIEIPASKRATASMSAWIPMENWSPQQRLSDRGRDSSRFLRRSGKRLFWIKLKNNKWIILGQNRSAGHPQPVILVVRKRSRGPRLRREQNRQGEWNDQCGVFCLFFFWKRITFPLPSIL